MRYRSKADHVHQCRERQAGKAAEFPEWICRLIHTVSTCMGCKHGFSFDGLIICRQQQHIAKLTTHIWVFAGKAAKYIGKLGGKLARNFSSNEPRPVSFSASRAPDEEVGGSGGDKKGAHLRALVAAHDGSVWVAFKAGRVERYQFNAKLLWSKVGVPHMYRSVWGAGVGGGC